MIDLGMFSSDRLVTTLLNERERPWLKDVDIVPDYMPPHPRKDTNPRCVIRYSFIDKRDGESEHCFLRYSGGPRQGVFWDMYGDDFLYPELALIALVSAQAPPPALGLYFCLKFSIPLGPAPQSIETPER